MSDNRNQQALVAGAATATVGVAAGYWWTRYSSSSSATTKPKKFHIEYEAPKTPWIMTFLAAVLPTSTRRNIIKKQSKPRPPFDGVDVLDDEDDISSGTKSGKYNPYTEMKELVPNKLWRVRYRYIQDFDFAELMKQVFGVDFEDPALLESIVDDEKLRKNMEQAMQDRAAMKVKIQGLKTKKEKMKLLCQAGYEESQNMMVLRLEDDEGSLLLFNPVRLHPPLLEWLASKGPVRWIVSGSSSHTNFVPAAVEAFPNAKIVCAQVANDKCQLAGMRPADYIYTDPKQLKEVSDLLDQASNKHVRLVHIKGDILTQSLCVIAYGHLLEVDLACYGDGRKIFVADQDDWDNNTEDKHIALQRLSFGAAFLTGKIKGYLPNMRLMAMDPACALAKWITLEAPNTDLSSCQEMAESIRQLLKATDYQYVDSAHSLRKESVPVDEFKQALNGMWSWLDGSSLLTDKQK